jgi:hypothetical protein
LLAGLAIAVLTASSAWSLADEKGKDKPKAAAKPPTRSYSDEDLKKYKEPTAAASVEGQTGSAESSSADEPSSDHRRRRPEGGGGEGTPRRRRAAEPPSADVDSSSSPDPAVVEPSSPEEAGWRARAEEARRPLEAAQNRVQGIEAEMAELRDKLNPMSTKYVLGGNSTEGSGAVYEVEEKLRVLEGHLVDARAAVVEAERSWQRFLDEARASGASPAWLYP